MQMIVFRCHLYRLHRYHRGMWSVLVVVMGRPGIVRGRCVAQHTYMSRHEALVRKCSLYQLVRVLPERRRDNRAHFDL